MSMESTTPSVTAVIPTYNRQGLVVQTIESVLNQTRLPDEVIVIDDGSTDRTAEAVAAFGGRVRYLRQANTGKAAALNRAVAQVESHYVWLMDDDDIALPHALETHLRFLGAHQNIDFSYGSHYEFTGNEPPAIPELCTQEPMPIAETEPGKLFIRAMIAFPFFLQSMLVPRRCYERVGPFDESLTFTEDYDMILRLARYYRGGNVQAPIFCLRIHPGLRGPAHERRAASERDAAFRGYARRIFSSLYVSLPLIEYLPRGARSGPVNADQVREARLQRACIMSRHGLFDEAFEDFRKVLNASSDGMRLTGRERRILSQMLSVEAWWLREYPCFAASVGKLLRQRRAHHALQVCAIGLGWRLENSLRRQQFVEAMQIALHLRQLVGAARLPALVRAVFVRRYQRRSAA